MKIAAQMILAARQAAGIPARAPRRLPTWQHPEGARVFYQENLWEWLRAVRRLTAEMVTPKLPRIAGARTAGIALDDWADEFGAMMAAFKVEVARIPFEERQVTRETALRTAAFNKKQWQRITRAQYGVDITLAEPWLIPMIKEFSTTNSTLITSMQEDAIKRVSTWASDTVRQGGRAEDIRKALQKQFGISRNKAALIADDQVNKLNADITEARQTDLGVKEYYWETSMDSRVRDTHRHRQGKLFRWDRPPEDGHPGQPIRCRCKARPKLTGLLDLLPGEE